MISDHESISWQRYLYLARVSCDMHALVPISAIVFGVLTCSATLHPLHPLQGVQEPLTGFCVALIKGVGIRGVECA